MPVKPLRQRQAEATRDLIVTVARRRFTEHGYAGTSIEDIVSDAGIARGALYHHFAGKDAVFRAVYTAVLSDAVAGVLQAAAGAGDPWSALRAGMSAFLDACLDPAFRRVVVLDSVTVVQASLFEDHDEPPELAMLRAVLAPAAEELGGLDTDALAFVTLGGLYGSALFIARAERPEEARGAAEGVIAAVMDGLRARAGD